MPDELQPITTSKPKPRKVRKPSLALARKRVALKSKVVAPVVTTPQPTLHQELTARQKRNPFRHFPLIGAAVLGLLVLAVVGQGVGKNFSLAGKVETIKAQTTTNYFEGKGCSNSCPNGFTYRGRVYPSSTTTLPPANLLSDQFTEYLTCVKPVSTNQWFGAYLPPAWATDQSLQPNPVCMIAVKQLGGDAITLPMSWRLCSGDRAESCNGMRPPVMRSATGGVRQIVLNWRDTPWNRKHYKLYRNTTGNVTINDTLVNGDIPGSDSSADFYYTDTNVTVGQAYYYKVYAFDSTDATKRSDLSNEKSATATNPPPPPPAPVVPPAPLLNGPSVGNTYLNLSWTRTAITRDDGYKLYRSLTPGVTTSSALVKDTLISSFLDSSLTNNQPYYYRVLAYNPTAGASALSNEVTGTPMATKPEAVTDLTAVGGSRQVILQWTQANAPFNAPVTGYKLYRSLSPAVTTSDTLVSGTIPPSDTSYIDSDSALVNGTVYYYRILATNVIGDSDLSNLANATPSATAFAFVLGAPASELTVAEGSTVSTTVDVTLFNRSNQTVTVSGVDAYKQPTTARSVTVSFKPSAQVSANGTQRITIEFAAPAQSEGEHVFTITGHSSPGSLVDQVKMVSLHVVSAQDFIFTLTNPATTLTMTEGETKTVNMDMTLANRNNNESVSVAVSGARATGATADLTRSLGQTTFSTVGTQQVVLTITAPSGSGSTSPHTVTVTATSSTNPPVVVTKNIQVTVNKVVVQNPDDFTIMVTPSQKDFVSNSETQTQSQTFTIERSDHKPFTPTVRKETAQPWLNCSSPENYNSSNCTARSLGN